MIEMFNKNQRIIFSKKLKRDRIVFLISLILMVALLIIIFVKRNQIGLTPAALINFSLTSFYGCLLYYYYSHYYENVNNRYLLNLTLSKAEKETLLCESLIVTENSITKEKLPFRVIIANCQNSGELNQRKLLWLEYESIPDIKNHKVTLQVSKNIITGYDVL